MESHNLTPLEKEQLLAEGWILGAAYMRVSTGHQEKEETIDTQDHWIRDYCLRAKIILAGIYQDQACPYEIPVHERPDGRRLMAAAADKQFEVVVVYKSGRWSRYDDVFQVARKQLLKLGVDLVCIKEQLRWKTPSDRLQSKIVLAANEFEKDNLSDNFLDGLYRVASQGYYTGGVVDYGYTTEADGQRKRYVILEEEAEVIRRIYRMLIDDLLSCDQIAKRLNQEGVQSAIANPSAGYRGCLKNVKTPGKWRHAMIATLIRKPIYRGLKKYGGGLKEPVYCSVPAIVSPETWQLAQERLAANKILCKRHSQREYLLAGKVHCENCGLVMTHRTTYTKLSGDTARYLICPAVRNQKQEVKITNCPIRQLRCNDLETIVWERLVEHLVEHEETLKRLAATWGSERGDLLRLENEQDALTKERDRLESVKRMAMQSKSPVGFEVTLDDARTLYNEARRDLEMNAQAAKDLEIAYQHALDRTARLKEVEGHLYYWHSRIHGDHSFRAKRHLIHMFVKEIMAAKDEEGLFFTCRFRFDETGEVAESGTKGGESGLAFVKGTRRHTFHNYILELVVRLH